MYTIDDKYELIGGFAIGCYRFIENEDTEEHFWVDMQNCEYYTHHSDDYNEETWLLGGNNWWILLPFKPIGTTITKENQNLVKWFVGESSKPGDEDKEWDFDKHSVKEK